MIETLLFNVVIPDTFNDDNNVVLFDKVANPETFYYDNNVVLLFNNVNPDIFNEDMIETLLLNVVDPETYKWIVFKFEKLVYPFIYHPNRLVVVLLRFVIASIDVVDKLFKSFLT